MDARGRCSWGGPCRLDMSRKLCLVDYCLQEATAGKCCYALCVGLNRWGIAAVGLTQFVCFLQIISYSDTRKLALGGFRVV